MPGALQRLGLMEWCVFGKLFTMLHVFSHTDQEQTDPMCGGRRKQRGNSHLWKTPNTFSIIFYYE